MPTILRLKGYRFFFYTNDHHPPHVHVEKGGSTAKFRLEPVELIKSKKFNVKEIHELRDIVIENLDFIKNKWYEYFNYK